ncbi:MAG TPA: hypothetical protein VFC71_01925 [Candidatus Polarisedimenticolia bacterium]|nr:hypothetical protein [Candidatus Polarisedimenticolia bacterium]
MTAMGNAGRRASTLSAVALAVLAACSGNQPSASIPASSPSAPPASATPGATLSAAPSSAAAIDVPGGLGEALAFADVETQRVTFTDWAAIKAAIGASSVTSSTPLDEKLAALAQLNGLRDAPPTEAIFGGFATSFLRTHVDLWGFDALDLDWDASIQGAQPPMWVLRFRPGFDFSAFQAKLDEYGFTSEQLPRGILRSHEHFVGATYTDAAGRTSQLAPTTEFQIGNTAFLDDGRTVVMFWDPRDAAAGPALIRDGLTNGFGGTLDLSLESVARLLDAPFAARLEVGSSCGSFAVQARDPEVRASIDALLDEAGPLDAYNALGIGYSREHDPIGRVVMGYAEEAAAQADLAGRRLLAERGIESHGRPYAELWFTLGDARVEERSVVVDLAPVNDLARNLILAAINRDMLFASCPD